jgi:cytochrome P450
MTDGFDPLSPSNLADPSTAYAFLHEHAPVHHFTRFDPPFYTLSRYEDVEAGLRDIATFSSHWGQGPRYSPPHGMLSDPPQHTFFRSLVQKAFTPKAIEALTGRVFSLAEELLDARPQPEWDLHDDYAFPLPVIVIAEMLGIRGEDLHLFKRWSDASVAAMGAVDPTPYQAELGQMGQYLLREIAARRADPSGTDLITGLVNATEEGRGLEDGEILGIARRDRDRGEPPLRPAGPWPLPHRHA